MRKNTYRTIGTLVAAVMIFAGATASANISDTAKAQTTTIDSGTMENPTFMISGNAGWIYDANNPAITDRAGNPLRSTWIKFDFTNENVSLWAKNRSYPDELIGMEYTKYTPTVSYMYADENGYYNHEGWKQIDGAWYYFNSSHFIITNFWVDENRYYVGADGAWVQDKVDDGSTDQKAVYKYSQTSTNTTTNSTSSNTSTETNENGTPRLPKGEYVNKEEHEWCQEMLPKKNLLN